MRTQTTFTFEACVTEMPLSSGGDVSVSISPPCLWRGAGDGADVVFVYLVAPRHPPACSSLGKRMEDEMGV